ncbi:hypothetical protein [Methylophaga frappieri]|uniref:hypothetical protein n=1 Tax=Methylophaga frappieri (strain ATCC BAA-2434 / DSM 25690 / JAM7) TaxID=754477 RepID=UPI0012442001|nr:hypothetical protein [Methylophaga frappieri]
MDAYREALKTFNPDVPVLYSVTLKKHLDGRISCRTQVIEETLIKDEVRFDVRYANTGAPNFLDRTSYAGKHGHVEHEFNSIMGWVRAALR